MSDQKAYYLAFSHCLGVGPATFDLLLKGFGSAEAAYQAPIQKVSELAGLKIGRQLEKFRKEFDIKNALFQLEKKGITVLTREDPRFPPQLLQIPDVPICLYAKGDLHAYDFQEELLFAIVGTRKPTSYGQHIAYTFASELAASGVVIVSGMALGIDTLAHRGALAQKGRTIAFLGCGVDVVYPPANQRLYDEILAGGGLLLSEFPPGHSVLPGLFVARNRLISGLSQGVMVVGGERTSGALITARYAAEQGRDVYAPPVPITSIMSEAPNILLKEGARLVTTPRDILEDYHVVALTGTKSLKDLNLGEKEQEIFDLLRREELMVDDILVKTQKDIDSILQILTMMEVKGIIRKTAEGKFQLKI